MPDSTRSGGLLLYKGNTANDLKVLIAHPGGPFFKNRDNGYWSLPKGEPEDKEEMFDAALREFKEETGMSPTGPYIELGTIIQKNGKTVYAWAFRGNWPDGKIPDCNKISMEYPKGSGKVCTFPEIDEVRMLSAEDARLKLRKEQHLFLDRLIERLYI